MPRKPIDLPYKIESLSILDENGDVDKDLEPELSADDLKKMYWFMLLARRAERRAAFGKLRRGEAGQDVRRQQHGALGRVGGRHHLVVGGHASRQPKVAR